MAGGAANGDGQQELFRVQVTENDQWLFIYQEERELADSFRRFHADNPQVYATLHALARDWCERRPGRKCGIGMLFEVARWHLTLSTVGEPVTLNNNYRAFYARLLMDREPELNGMFELRRQRGPEFDPSTTTV